MDMTIVIPQRGQIELTLDCLASLRRVERNRWPVVVVDDGSTAEQQERFLRLKPAGVRLIVQSAAGVTAAWNRGVSHVCTTGVLFLNNDVLFHRPVMEQFVAALSSTQTYLAGVRLRRETLPLGATAESRHCQLLEGWAMACRIEDYYRVGGFDEQFSLYYSDTDFQLRMREEFGPSGLRLVDDLGLEHLGHRTAHRQPTQRQFWQRDRELFRQKWERINHERTEVKATAGL